MVTFIPGLQLSQYFFDEAIQPLMKQKFPHLAYSAARLAWGSDVMGFDTPMSMDHGWGPKMTLFFTNKDFSAYQHVINETLANHLPFEIHRFPTNFGEPFSDGGVMLPTNSYPIHHQVTLTTTESFFADYLGLDIHQPLTPVIWLCLPQQKLRTLRAGRIFHDGLGILSEIRQKLHWYPRDLWYYLLANQWQRIDQEEAFVGRSGSVGDTIGSRLIAGRIIHDLMQLGFLMEREYAPYMKWYGTGFQQLKIAPILSPIFKKIMNSQASRSFQSWLSKAYILLAEKHNALNITPTIESNVSSFYKRPFLVPHAARFVEALLAQIRETDVLALPPHLGSIDQIVNNTDLLESVSHCQKLQILYQDTVQT